MAACRTLISGLEAQSCPAPLRPTLFVKPPDRSGTTRRFASVRSLKLKLLVCLRVVQPQTVESHASDVDEAPVQLSRFQMLWCAGGFHSCRRAPSSKDVFRCRNLNDCGDLHPDRTACELWFAHVWTSLCSAYVHARKYIIQLARMLCQTHQRYFPCQVAKQGAKPPASPRYRRRPQEPPPPDFALLGHPYSAATAL